MNEEIYTAYSASADMTFILKDTLDNDGTPYRTEVIGFYYGEPDEENTRRYMGDLIAEYK